MSASANTTGSIITNDQPSSTVGCTCHACGLKYRGDLLVPDEIWEQINPSQIEGAGLLCPTCTVNRIVDAKICTVVRAVDGDATAKTLKDAWADFCDANPDDLTSPEDLPDHALMTCRQFVDYALSALSRPQVNDEGRAAHRRRQKMSCPLPAAAPSKTRMAER